MWANNIKTTEFGLLRWHNIVTIHFQINCSQTEVIRRRPDLVHHKCIVVAHRVQSDPQIFIIILRLHLVELQEAVPCYLTFRQLHSVYKRRLYMPFNKPTNKKLQSPHSSLHCHLHISNIVTDEKFLTGCYLCTVSNSGLLSSRINMSSFPNCWLLL